MTKSIQNPLLLFIVLFSCFSLQAQHTHFQTGDIFLAQAGGIIQWRDSNHVLIRNINTGDATGAGVGLRIHPITGQLWVANSSQGAGAANGIRIINTDGTPGNSVNVSAYQQSPTSITFDKQGNAYTGDLWSKEIVKINQAGTAVLDHYTISTNNFIWGAEWVEMDCNDSIIYYTHLKETLRRFNVVTRQQLPDFADLTGIPTWLFAMRRLPDSSMIVVSADNRILRLNAAGGIIQNYAPANLCGFWSMAATPDGKYFWAGGGAFYSPMYKFDIASGNVVDSFFATLTQGSNIHGIAIYGDELKNCKPQSPPDTIPQVAVASSIRSYPNPSHGSFILQTNLTGKLTVLVYDKLGQPVYAKEYSFSGNNHNIPIDIRNQPAGIYFLQIVNDGKRVSEKIVIN